MMDNFKVDNESRFIGYDLICNKCGFRITYDMKHALENKICPSCGNKEDDSNNNSNE